MTIKKAVPLLLAVAVALVVTGAAQAKKPLSGQWQAGYTTGYTETQTDLQGNVISTSAQTDLPAGTVMQSKGGGAAMPAPGTPTIFDAPTPFACCSASGCDTVTPYVTKKDSFGIMVVWRYGQTAHWCWSYPRIASFSAYGHFWDVDGTSAKINYSDNGYGYYYTWAGSTVGGHFSDRQGSVSNCVFHYGCFGTSYPEIQVWINGNGAWTSRVVDTG